VNTPASDPAPREICFEHPLGERTRLFLRLETLLQRVHDLRLRGARPLEATLVARELLELGELLARGDVRTELLKELERLELALHRWDGHRDAHGPRLAAALEEIGERRRRLFAVEGRFVDRLRACELLATLRQRVAMPGGLNGAEIPSYRLWIALDDEARAADLDRWIAILAPLRDALTTYLRLVRTSARFESCRAEGGNYEREIGGQDPPVHLVRLFLPSVPRLFPEISAGRYRLSVRFREFPDADRRGGPFGANVDFRLQLAAL
jgi:cell division protein ZapD